MFMKFACSSAQKIGRLSYHTGKTKFIIDCEKHKYLLAFGALHQVLHFFFEISHKWLFFEYAQWKVKEKAYMNWRVQRSFFAHIYLLRTSSISVAENAGRNFSSKFYVFRILVFLNHISIPSLDPLIAQQYFSNRLILPKMSPRNQLCSMTETFHRWEPQMLLNLKIWAKYLLIVE